MCITELNSTYCSYKVKYGGEMMKWSQDGGSHAYLSPDALVLLRLEEIEQHLQKRRVLAVGLHHISCTGHLLTQCPQRHLVGRYPINKEAKHMLLVLCPYPKTSCFELKYISLLKPIAGHVSHSVTGGLVEQLFLDGYINWIANFKGQIYQA